MTSISQRFYPQDGGKNHLEQNHVTFTLYVYPIHTARPDTTKQSCLCRVGLGGVNSILYNSRLWPTENLKSDHVNSNCPIHTGHARRDTDETFLSCPVWLCELSRPDRPTGAFCVWSVSECVGRSQRSPPRRRQLRLAARPPTRSDVVRHAECKHAVDCCI